MAPPFNQWLHRAERDRLFNDDLNASNMVIKGMRSIRQSQHSKNAPHRMHLRGELRRRFA